jgi:hypothetical protein
MPLPAIYVKVEFKNKWRIIIGDKIISSIYYFTNKNIKLRNLYLLPELNNLLYEELPGHLKRRINETILHIQKIEVYDKLLEDIIIKKIQNLNNEIL